MLSLSACFVRLGSVDVFDLSRGRRYCPTADCCPQVRKARERFCWKFDLTLRVSAGWLSCYVLAQLDLPYHDWGWLSQLDCVDLWSCTNCHLLRLLLLLFERKTCRPVHETPYVIHAHEMVRIEFWLRVSVLIRMRWTHSSIVMTVLFLDLLLQRLQLIWFSLMWNPVIYLWNILLFVSAFTFKRVNACWHTHTKCEVNQILYKWYRQSSDPHVSVDLSQANRQQVRDDCRSEKRRATVATFNIRGQHCFVALP